jgi:lysozyme
VTTPDRDALKLDLMRDEGVRLRPYTDTVGKLTIGCGRNLSDRGISHDEAQFLLENDMDLAIHECLTFPWFADLDGVRQRVVANMCFNLGLSRLRGFKNTLRYIERGEFVLAAANMLKSKWARQVGQRAIRLSRMMETGQA